MSLWMSLFNNVAVSVFGSVLAASFCDALDRRKNRIIFWICIALIPIAQGIIYYVWDDGFLRQIYPLLVHVPLILLLCGLTGKLLWPFFSVMAAYLCCQLRRWLALLAVEILGGGALMLDVVELLITLPLLFGLMHFMTPAVRYISGYSRKMQCQFGVIPVLYYVFDYLTRVYTDLLSSGAPVVVEFMPFICCGAYLVFLLYNFTKGQEENRMKEIQKSLDMQVAQSMREITALRESQNLASRYRHDLRHHLQYLYACLENHQIQKAEDYISDICNELEQQKVIRYCENEAANLILSSFAGRAEAEGIVMKVEGGMKAKTVISDTDLCVLLSNALENAIHACREVQKEGKEARIEVQIYEKQQQVFLQIKNSCAGAPIFENGVPVSKEKGHGIGTRSICAIVERYGGVYTFSVEKEYFILRLNLSEKNVDSVHFTAV